MIGALFILPFLLFSATSGQLADKLEKTLLIRYVKTRVDEVVPISRVAHAILAFDARG